MTDIRECYLPPLPEFMPEPISSATLETRNRTTIPLAIILVFVVATCAIITINMHQLAAAERKRRDTRLE
jgi:hypothetical protein